MLVVKIIITIVCAGLTLPFFPYGFFGMRDDEKAEECIEKEVVRSQRITVLGLLGILVVVSIVISVDVLFYSFEGRDAWFIYLLPFCWPIAFQSFYACNLLKRELLPIVLPALAVLLGISIFTPIRDALLPYETENVQSSKNVFIVNTIKERFEASSISYAGSNNEHLVYVLDGGPNGRGVLFVNADSDYLSKGVDSGASIMEETLFFSFYPCKYTNSINGIVREKYKKEEIVQLGIYLENQTPYCKFGILKRPGIFQKPQLDYIVSLNMMTGEIEET